MPSVGRAEGGPAIAGCKRIEYVRAWVFGCVRTYVFATFGSSVPVCVRECVLGRVRVCAFSCVRA